MSFEFKLEVFLKLLELLPDTKIGKALVEFYRGGAMRAWLHDDAWFFPFLDACRHHSQYKRKRCLRVYRGQPKTEFLEGRIGASWTDDLKTARMFKGYHSTDNAGVEIESVLLEVMVSPDAIVAKVVGSDEREWIIDPRMLDVQQIRIIKE